MTRTRYSYLAERALNNALDALCRPIDLEDPRAQEELELARRLATRILVRIEDINPTVPRD